jgi:UDP-GlcNAc:undecaprenyl-phosphate GlcNAc-1-phosphate transferase
MTTSLGIFVVAWVASLLLTPVVTRLAIGRALFDEPDHDRRVHTQPIPRVGGVAVFVSMLLGLLLLVPQVAGEEGLLQDQQSFFAGILVGSLILFTAGLVDDLVGLQPRTKIAVQLLAALAVYSFGFQISEIGFGSSFELSLGWLALPVTLLWVVGVTNSFNLIDGLDGLATGVALVALAATAVAAQLLHNFEVTLVCVALIGALLGFLRYNFNPARVFLGDSGSLFIGFLLAVLSVHGATRGGSAVLALIPLSALALPLLDTALAIGRRWLRRVPLSRPDSRHIHHRLLALGLAQRTAVLLLYCVATTLAVAGVCLTFAPPSLIFAVAASGGLICGVILLYGLRQLEYHEFVDAAVVLASGLLRTRQVISDEIRARDLSQELRNARDIEAVNAALRAQTGSFSFLEMKLCRQSAPPVPLSTMNVEDRQRAWKLDFPVEVRTAAVQDPFVLRIWCGRGNPLHPFGAERVARVLATTLEEWLLATRPEVVVLKQNEPVNLLDYARDSARTRAVAGD